MERLKEVLNKKEVFAIVSLFCLFLLTTVLFAKYYGHPIIDGGREAIFPKQMLDGKVLYKDIFNIFGPLSYQINAFVYSLLGVKINSLRLAGIFNSGLLLFLFYAVARQYTSIGISWICSLFIMVSCIFNPSSFNYIYPYGFAVIYSLTFLVGSFLALLLYLKSSNKLLLNLSFILAGACLATKSDYIFSTALTIGILFYLRYRNQILTKDVILNLSLFSVVPFLSFLALFIQGVSFENLIYQAEMVKKLTLTPTNYKFYSTFVGTFLTKQSFKISFETFMYTVPRFLLLLVSFYVITSRILLKKRYFLKYLWVIIVCLLIYIGIGVFRTVSFNVLFAWMPLVIAVIFLFFVYKFFIKKEYKFNKYLLLLIFSLAASIKTLFFLNMASYGTYSLPLFFIALVVYLVEYLPEKIKFIDKKYLKASMFLFILLMTGFFTPQMYLIKKYPYETPLGTIYMQKSFIAPYAAVVDYIRQTTKPTDKVWIIPEGIMINLLTDRESNGAFYSIIPPFMEMYGEDRLIQGTKEEGVEYIVVNNRTSGEYGYDNLCYDYGQKLCTWIKQNYAQRACFQTPRFQQCVLKKKY